jgi:hypothetical protein
MPETQIISLNWKALQEQLTLLYTAKGYKVISITPRSQVKLKREKAPLSDAQRKVQKLFGNNMFDGIDTSPEAKVIGAEVHSFKIEIVIENLRPPATEPEEVEQTVAVT